MNLNRPDYIPPPPAGWIYAKGPLNQPADNRNDLLWWYGREWTTGNISGAAHRHYAVREGSPTAIANGMREPTATPTPEQMTNYQTKTMNTVRPPHIPAPAKGWIYVEGPLKWMEHSIENLMVWEENKWVPRRLAGNGNLSYAVRAGSRNAIKNDLVETTIPQETLTLKQIYMECYKNEGSIIILSDPCSSDGRKLMAKGILKKAVAMVCADKGHLMNSRGMSDSKRWEIAYNSRLQLFTLLAKRNETANQIAEKISHEMRWNSKVQAIIPKHMGFEPSEMQQFNNNRITFRVL